MTKTRPRQRPPCPLRQHIARELRDEAILRGITQRQIAAHVGLSQPTISRIMAGLRDMRLDDLYGICATLHIDCLTIVARAATRVGIRPA